MSSKNALETIQDSAIRRAIEADPNNGRCLIENCSQSKAVQGAHVFDGSHGQIGLTMDPLEWSWRMVRGTLNLDTRRNVFFLGAALKELYANMKWVLLPEKEVVLSHIDEDLGGPCMRSEYRDTEGDLFRYKFLPIQDMEDIYLTRQYTENNEQRVAIHHYPFDDFPVVESHIHPKFAILQLGEVLEDVDGPIKISLFAKYPWFEELEDIYCSWKTSLPHGAERDALYKYKHYSGYEDPSTIIDSDLYNTPPRRLQTMFPPTPPEPPYGYVYYDMSPGSEESSIQSTFVLKPNHKKRPASSEVNETQPTSKRRLLTSSTLEALEEVEGAESTDGLGGRLTKWVEGCQPLPSSSLYSVLLASQSLLRRSERVRARLQK